MQNNIIWQSSSILFFLIFKSFSAINFSNLFVFSNSLFVLYMEKIWSFGSVWQYHPNRNQKFSKGFLASAKAVRVGVVTERCWHFQLSDASCNFFGTCSQYGQYNTSVQAFQLHQRYSTTLQNTSAKQCGTSSYVKFFNGLPFTIFILKIILHTTK